MSNLRVLIVDDSANMRKIVTTILRGFGVREIFQAIDGVEGLEMLKLNQPDLVLLDIEMPILDGHEFLRFVRTPETEIGTVPIIVLTAHTERSQVLRTRQAGAHDFLAKPVSPKQLYARIVDLALNPREFISSAEYFGPRWRNDGAPKSRFSTDLKTRTLVQRPSSRRGATNISPLQDSLESYDDAPGVDANSKKAAFAGPTYSGSWGRPRLRE